MASEIGKSMLKCFYLISGYVDEMKTLLFSLSKAVMKVAYARYATKAPQSLTSQFPDRISKPQAVKTYEKQKQKSTQLFPPGK